MKSAKGRGLRQVGIVLSRRCSVALEKLLTVADGMEKGSVLLCLWGLLAAVSKLDSKRTAAPY